jgi:serine/threonine kinase 16
MTSTMSYSVVDMGRDAASGLYNWLLSLCCSVACTTTTVAVNHRVVRVVRLLAEGGFSFVYLVENGSEKFALKKVLSQTPEQSDAARWEIKVHSSIDHPNCMPLIDHCVATTPAGAEEFRLLMPLYPHGTLLDKCVKHMQAGTRIPERTALQIFQVQSPLMASDGLSECP